MSNSSLVNITVPANINNYMIGRNGVKISEITIHHMAGVLTAEECGRLFQNPNKASSTHYGIGKNGETGLYVDEKNTAYANGNFESNLRSVTIEVSNSTVGGDYPVADNVLNILIQIVADIAKRNNLGKLVNGVNLMPHNKYIATSCPGRYLLSKMDYIANEANKINGYGNSKTNEEIADEVIKGLWGNGKERKDRLTEAGYDYYAVQDIVNEKLLVKKSNEQIAREVIRGDWGNGKERKDRLTKAGYDYYAIQKNVNDMLKITI